jgi:hypothetical protein
MSPNTSRLRVDHLLTAFGAGPIVLGAWGWAEKEASGIDTKGDQTLDDDEVTSSNLVCNEHDFSARSEAGSVRAESGFDVHGNERLDEEELAHDDIVCHQGHPLFETESARVGSSVCPHGETKIRLGYDDGEPAGTAGDGRLQRGEVTLVQDVCTKPNETDASALGGSKLESESLEVTFDDGPRGMRSSWNSTIGANVANRIRFHVF